MQNLPAPVDDAPSGLALAGVYLLVPVVAVVLLPAVLLLVVALYALALIQGVRALSTALSGRGTPPTLELQEPHFLHARIAEKQLSDQSPPPSS